MCIYYFASSHECDEVVHWYVVNYGSGYWLQQSFHCQRCIVNYSRGSDTLLGEASDGRELFLVDDCQNTEIPFIVHKVTVSSIILTLLWVCHLLV